MSNTNERISLLLTDVLGDLKIVGESGALWTPESVQLALEKEDTGGLGLASALLNPLTGKSDNKLESWKGLIGKHAALCPPWVTETDLTKKPLTSKLEILSFLASTLQNRLLRQMKKTTPKTNPASSSTSSSADPALSLPPNLTEEQKAIVMECYHGLKADYDKRRVGMKQRLDILVSNFESDNADDKDMAALKQHIQNMSVSSAALPVHLSEAEVLTHFQSPHSKGLGSRTPVPKSGAANPLESLTIVDRGGRTNEAESRISMPTWSG